MTLPEDDAGRDGRPHAADLDAFHIARRHPMVRTQPTPDFFEGLLLGNGDVGVCLVVRPDALGLHIGKNDCWDIRVSEEHTEHVRPFHDVVRLWEQASAEAQRQDRPDGIHVQHVSPLREYVQAVRTSYDKPWPRPWPCGTVWLHWDSRMVTVVRQTLDISTGEVSIELEHDDLRGTTRGVVVSCFVSQGGNHISVSTSGFSPVTSVAYYPHVDPASMLPDPELDVRISGDVGEFDCYQRLPAVAPTAPVPEPPSSPDDSGFALSARLDGGWDHDAVGAPPEVFVQAGPRPPARTDGVQLRRTVDGPLRLDVTVFTPRDATANLDHARSETARLSAIPVDELRAASQGRWQAYWARSAVDIVDRELERIWYHNQYFLACCVKEGSVAPGLFANWASGELGAAWHGDYHLDYNAQQLYWGVFSSNHVEQHLPYIELLEKLQPLASAVAHEHFGLPGTFYPVSVYPGPSTVNPFPVPPWFYMMCVGPWTVQSLWWHFVYTQDRELLQRVYPMLANAARFMSAYLRREDDGKYHIFPTVSSENWGFTAGFRLNRDATMDLALTAFVLEASIAAAELLDRDAGDRARWGDVLENMAPYPCAEGSAGKVWLDIDGAPLDHVYNVPAPTTPVFPGEQVGIGRRPELLDVARRTSRLIRLEGGNDLVFQSITRARLAMLDLEEFKREVRYCLLPNGTCGDRLRQIGGRYGDLTDFDYPTRMGVWAENFALPAVLNECMLQTYTGVIRLFPNTGNLGPAGFSQLRAAGAFLVDASWDGSTVLSPVEIVSDRGGQCRVANPWPGPVRVTRHDDGQHVDVTTVDEVLHFETEAGQRYLVERDG